MENTENSQPKETMPAAATSAAPVEKTSAPAQTGSYRFAGFWIRFVAGLIDGVIIAIVSFLLQNVLGDENQTLSTILSAGYHIGMWVKMDGMTIGKKVMGIKVIQTDGNPVSIKTAVLRYVGYIVSALGLCLGYIWVAFDKNKQGWHDKIASTYVIYK